MSKNYQINYNVNVKDLTPEAIKKIKANLKSLADSQIENNKRIFDAGKKLREGLKKQQQKQSEDSKKFAKDEMMRARIMQLNSKKSYMEKVRQLKMIRGKEESLVKYIQNKESQLRRVRSNVYADPAKEYQNTLKELALMNLRNRAETMLGQAITANNRKREQSLKLQQQLAQRRQYGEVAVGAGAGVALKTGASAVVSSLESTMTQEQLRIALQAQLGDSQGAMALEEFKKYSLETMFKLQDTIRLFLDVRKGASNIGLNTLEQQIAFTKTAGRPLLAYSTNAEGRSESGYQLGQIIMAGTANERQDVKVIARHGIPIYSALNKMTGKTYDQLQELYGKELPAWLIRDAFIFMDKSKEVLEAMNKYEKSLTIAWQATGEQFEWTSAKFGERVSEALRIPGLLRLATKGLNDAEEAMTGKKDSGLLGYVTIVSGLTLGFFALNGAIVAATLSLRYFVGTALAANLGLTSGELMFTSLITKAGIFAGIASAIYLGFTDWQPLFDSWNKNGLKGLMTQLDKITAMLSVLGLGFLTGGIVGLTVAAAGITAVGLVKLAGDNMSKAVQLGSISKYATPSQVMENYNKNKSYEAKITPIPSQPTAPVLNVETHVNVEKDKTTTKTLVRGDYSDEYFDTIINKKR